MNNSSIAGHNRRIAGRCATFCLLGLLFALGCNGPVEPVFDNLRDPLGEFYLPNRPSLVGAGRIDTASVVVSMFSNDSYDTALVLERQDGADGTFRYLATVSIGTWTYIDRENIRTGMTYYYRAYSLGPKGQHSSYSMVSSVRI